MSDFFSSDLIWISILFATLRMSTPLIFAAMGGLISERSGVINIALEGFMLVGAWVGAVAALKFGNAWIGWIMAGCAGAVIAAVYGIFAIELKADQIVAGTAINLLVIGVNPFITKVFFNSTGSTPPLALESRFSFEPTMMAFVVGLILHFWLTQIRSGLWLSFAGEHPSALTTAGISVRKVRWSAVLISGVLAAWGGSSLSLYLSSSYSPMMSGGRGFMALAALIFGKWKPIPALLACLFFGLTDAIQIRLQGVPFFGFEIPVQFVQVLPYVVTIVALAGFIGQSRPPKSLGRPI